MNKIIKGKRYNTELAIKLGECDNRIYDTNDFTYCWETLYRTQSGNYFLYGKGSALGKNANWNENSDGSSEIIIPMALEEAKEWVQVKLSGDEYEAIFGEIEEIEDDRSEKITITLPRTLIKSLREKKETTGANLSWLVTKALRDAGYGDKK